MEDGCQYFAFNSENPLHPLRRELRQPNVPTHPPLFNPFAGAMQGKRKDPAALIRVMIKQE